MFKFVHFVVCCIVQSGAFFFCVRHSDIDMIIIREQTEGEYTSLEHEVCDFILFFPVRVYLKV